MLLHHQSEDKQMNTFLIGNNNGIQLMGYGGGNGFRFLGAPADSRITVLNEEDPDNQNEKTSGGMWAQNGAVSGEPIDEGYLAELKRRRIEEIPQISA